MERRNRYLLIIVCLILTMVFNVGCARLLNKFTQPVVDNLTNSFMKQKDIEMAKQGAPTMLLIIDGLIEGKPESEMLLLGGARAISAYSSAFLVGKEPERAYINLSKAKDYAFRAMSVHNEKFNEVKGKSYEEFITCLPTFTEEDVPILFWTANCWALYVIGVTGAKAGTIVAMDAMADLPQIEAMFERVVELDEFYYYGGSHLYLGVLKCLRPAVYGGKPEEGRNHFERALEISEGKLFLTSVMYARMYARSVYDRELHDNLLQKVLDTPPDKEPNLTLMNLISQDQAQKLMESADDYF